LRLPGPAPSAAELDWAALLPDDDVTCWLSVDRVTCTLTIDPGAAEPDLS
jgi:hypothetical protein